MLIKITLVLTVKILKTIIKKALTSVVGISPINDAKKYNQLCFLKRSRDNSTCKNINNGIIKNLVI